MRLNIVCVGLCLAACSGDGGTSTGSTEPTGTTGIGTTDATTTTDMATTASATLDSEATPTTTMTPTTTDGDTTTNGDTTTGGDTTTAADTTTDSGPDSSTGGVDTDTGTSTGDGTSETGADTSTGAVGECESGAKEACYSGPPGTLGVGMCAAGERTCTDGAWGGCVGQVLPAAESCDVDGDENCDGEDACPTYAWSRAFASAGSDTAREVAIDGAGNVVVVVTGSGSLDLGGGVLANKGGFDLFLARYAPGGEHLWSKNLGGSAGIYPLRADLAVTAAGDIAISGTFAGSIDLGGGPLVDAVNASGFVGRLAADGSHVWSKLVATNQFVRSNGVGVTDEGALLIGGSFGGALDLGGGPLVSAGGSDGFVGKFTAAGEHVWSRRFGDAQTQGIQGVSGLVGGGVCVGGVFMGSIDLGGGPLVSAGGYDVFLGCLDSQGATQTARRVGTTGGDEFIGVAVDGEGRVNLLVRVVGNIDLGGGPLGGPGLNSVVGQYDPAGAHVWSRLVGNNGAFAEDLAVDGQGAVLVTGQFDDPNDFGGGALDSVALHDVFVLKLGPAGDYAWARALAGSADDAGEGIAGGATGTVAVTGLFLGDFDPGSDFLYTSKGSLDGFLSVFNP